MENPFDIFKPTRRICNGKSVKHPISNLNPNDWLVDGPSHFQSVEVDGYTIDNHGAVTAIMSRYEFSGKYENRKHFTDILTSKFSKDILSNIRLANKLKIPYRLFLWPEDFPSNYDILSKKIIVFFPKLVGSTIDLLDAKLINLKGLEAGIHKYRGRSYTYVKSLQSANSNVECHLANHTHNPWPGDIDGLLINKTNGTIKAIIEYKTHNIDSPIEDQYIGKYGKQDWRRFEVLYKLQSAISLAQGSIPSLFFIVWGTKNITNHKRIKIDQINNGKILRTDLIDRPNFGEFSEALIKLLLV